MRVLCAVLLVASYRAAFAQPSLTVAGCEPRQEVRLILEDNLAGRKLANMKFSERVAYRRQTLEDLIAKYPSEVEPYRQLIKATKEEDIDRYPALVDRFKRWAEQHPEDSMALYVAGLALSNRNTPLSVQFLERARRQQKDFAWPALELARIYAPGTKHPDAKRASEEISTFFAACPASADQTAQNQLSRSGSNQLQTQVAASMRAHLRTETNPRRLEQYATLWSLEFRIHSPNDYAALRRQVSADLKQLESSSAKPDVEWLVFLKDGYKLSSASSETVTSAEDRVIDAYPHSDEAYQIVRERWNAAHKEPESGKDTAGWAKYHSEYRTALKTWIAQFTESPELQHAESYYATFFDSAMPDDQGTRALDDYLTLLADYKQPSISGYETAAWVMVDHNWDPSRVFALLQDSNKLLDQWHQTRLGDNLSAETEELLKNNEIQLRQVAASNVLVAARLSEQPAQAERLKPFIERELPANSWRNIEALYWLNRGRLAMLEGRKADALTFYQKALQLRRVPDPVEGRLIDTIADESRAVWRQMGGTETAWNLWSKLPAGTLAESTANGWQKPAKPLPAFELTDLSGKLWRLKDLNGRVVLINVWATWCGPCQRELPHLQKLYKQVKDRSDLQILTFNIDEDPGVVEPFLKQRGFTYPVLPADSFVTSLLDMVGIPQNWIVDKKGEWRWTGQPAVPEAMWEAALLEQLKSVK